MKNETAFYLYTDKEGINLSKNTQHPYIVTKANAIAKLLIQNNSSTSETEKPVLYFEVEGRLITENTFVELKKLYKTCIGNTHSDEDININTEYFMALYNEPNYEKIQIDLNLKMTNNINVNEAVNKKINKIVEDLTVLIEDDIRKFLEKGVREVYHTLQNYKANGIDELHLREVIKESVLCN